MCICIYPCDINVIEVLLVWSKELTIAYINKKIIKDSLGKQTSVSYHLKISFIDPVYLYLLPP